MSIYTVVDEGYDVYVFPSKTRLREWFFGEEVFGQNGSVVSKNFLNLAFAGDTRLLYLYGKDSDGEIHQEWKYKIERHN